MLAAATDALQVGVQPDHGGGQLKVLRRHIQQEGWLLRHGVARRAGSRGRCGQSLGRDLKPHKVVNGLAHARLRQLLVGAEPEMIVESAPDCGVTPTINSMVVVISRENSSLFRS